MKNDKEALCILMQTTAADAYNAAGYFIECVRLGQADGQDQVSIDNLLDRASYHQLRARIYADTAIALLMVLIHCEGKTAWQ